MRKVLARTLFAACLSASVCPIGYGQLPPTNMGKYVHQPGDNQYSPQAQGERHSVASQRPASSPAEPALTVGTYHRTPAPPRPDYSLMPISCEEPLKPAGFPPLPDRLDFSNIVGYERFGSGVPRGSAAGAAATAGNAPYQGSSSGPRAIGVHQHYTHYDPGAFIPENGQKHSSYKVPTPGAADVYNVNSSPDAAPPAFHSDAGNALSHMGKEPRLSQDKPTQPAAPSAVTVNQSVSQDLSLPDDKFSSGQAVGRNNNGKRFANRAGQILARTGYRVMNQASSAATSMIRIP